MEANSKQFNEDQLIKDFKSVLTDLEDLLQVTANTGGEKLGEIRAKAETSLGAVKATMADAPATLLNKTKEAAALADDYVQDNPWRSIGLAASVGLIVGLLISRR